MKLNAFNYSKLLERLVGTSSRVWSKECKKTACSDACSLSERLTILSFERHFTRRGNESAYTKSPPSYGRACLYEAVVQNSQPRAHYWCLGSSRCLFQCLFGFIFIAAAKPDDDLAAWLETPTALPAVDVIQQEHIEHLSCFAA